MSEERSTSSLFQMHAHAKRELAEKKDLIRKQFMLEICDAILPVFNAYHFWHIKSPAVTKLDDYYFDLAIGEPIGWREQDPSTPEGKRKTHGFCISLRGNENASYDVLVLPLWTFGQSNDEINKEAIVIGNLNSEENFNKARDSIVKAALQPIIPRQVSYMPEITKMRPAS